MEQKTKGSGFLKVTGILMIIGGAIALIVSIIAVAGIGATVALAESFGVEVSSGMLWAAGILSLVSAIAELITGIVGVKNCKDPAKADPILGGLIRFGVTVSEWGTDDKNVDLKDSEKFNVTVDGWTDETKDAPLK